jgi:hypothetical protein
MDATDSCATIEEPLEALISVRSMPRLYNEGQLPLEESLEMTVERVGGWCGMASSLGVSRVSWRTAAVQSS